jgi:hypothetical protein
MSYEQLTNVACEDVPLYKPVIPENVIPAKKELQVKRQPVSIKTTVAGILGQKHSFTLHNTSECDIATTDTIVCSWCSLADKPIVSAAKTSIPAPACKRGEVIQVAVPIPKPPLTVGSLILDISILSGKKPLGLGAKVRMDFRG